MPTRRKLTPDEAASAASEETITVSESKEDLDEPESENASTVVDTEKSDDGDDEPIGEYLFDDLEDISEEYTESEDDTNYSDDDVEQVDEEAEINNGTAESVEGDAISFDEAEIVQEEVSPAARRTSSRTRRAPRVSREISEIGTFSDEFNKGLEQKHQAIRRMIATKRILKVKIIKSYVIKPNRRNNPNATRTVFAGCILPGYEEFNFLIPFDELDCFKMQFESSDDVSIDTKISYVREMIHAKVNVIAELSSFKERMVICSRQKANYVLRRRYFYTGYTLPNSPHIRRIIKDNTIIRNAHIISGNYNDVLMEAYGAQFKVPVSEISHNYLANAYSLHSGDVVDVKLLEVTTEQNDLKLAREYAPVRIVGSIKACKENIPMQALDNAELHETISGKITFITPDGDAVGVTDSGYNFRVVYANARIRHLRAGSEVTVKLVKKVYGSTLTFGLVDLDEVVKL